jgi:hypothetical protein
MFKTRQGQHLSWSAFSLLFIALVVLTACAAGTFGRLQRDQTAFQNFTTYNVLPGHRYYTTGVPGNPDAIIAVSDKYTLVTDRWQEQDMTRPLLSQTVGRMNAEVGVANSVGLLGSTILDDKGGRIGEWYSIVGLTTVEMLGENKVSVHPPAKAMLDRLKNQDRGR